LQGLDQLGFGEGLQQLDGDDTDFLALAAQVGGDGLGVVGDRAQADDDVLGVFGQEGVDGLYTRRSACRIRPSRRARSRARR